MPVLYNKQTGQPEEVPAEAFAQAVTSGAYGYARDQKFTMRRQGRMLEVTGDKLTTALREGWSPESAEQTRGREAFADAKESPGLAALAGVARGATLGLSDVGLRALGVERETLSALERANPTASTLGEVGGAVGSLFLPGGAIAKLGAAGKLLAAPRAIAGLGARTAYAVEGSLLRTLAGAAGRTAARSAAAKVAGFAAGGAVEGAAYAAGKALSEDALGEPNLVASAMAAHALRSGVEGAAGGALLGVVMGPAVLLAGKAASKSARFVERHLTREVPAEAIDATTAELMRIRGQALPGPTREAAPFVRGLASIVSGGVGASAGTAAGGLAGAMAGGYLGRRAGATFADNVPALVRIQEVAKKSADTIDSLLQRYLRKSLTHHVPASLGIWKALTGEKDKKKAVKKLSQELTQLKSSPSLLAARLVNAVGPLATTAPKVAEAYSKQMVRAVQYAHGIIPKPPEMIVPREWVLSDQALSATARKLAGVFDPMSVIEDLAAGTLTSDGVEGMRVAHQELWAETANQLLLAIAADPQDLDTAQRMQASLFLGRPVDQALEPSSVARTQALYAAQAPASKSSLKPLEGKGPQMETQTQRMEKPV